MIANNYFDCQCHQLFIYIITAKSAFWLKPQQRETLPFSIKKGNKYQIKA